MAAPLVSDDLWALVEPLLPPHPPRPQGGRPPVPDRACFTGIVFVLKTGIQWEDLPPGPNPTDRARPSTDRHLVTDRQGVPLAQLITPGNRNEITVLAALLDAVPPVRGKPGRPRRRPTKLHADKAYDFPAARRLLRGRGTLAR